MIKKTFPPLCFAIALILPVSAALWGGAEARSDKNANSPSGKRITFDREFSPSEGLVKGPEIETRQEICLNGKWDFQPIYGPYNQKRTPPYGINEDDGGKALSPDLPDPVEGGWDAAKIKIPSLMEFRRRISELSGKMGAGANGLASEKIHCALRLAGQTHPH